MCRKDNTLSLAKILDEDDVAIPIRHHRSAYMTAAGTGMCMLVLRMSFIVVS